jgi:hypothetical protein
LAIGKTSVGSSQKLSGRSASSVGAVRAISASESRRSSARSARPRLGLLTLPAALVIYPSLFPTASSGGDDPSNDVGFQPRTICKNQGDMDLIREADGNKSTFSIIPAFILHHQNGTFKNQGCECKVKAALPIIGIALFPVPCESHLATIQLYIHTVKALSREAGAIMINWKQGNGFSCMLQATWRNTGKHRTIGSVCQPT